MEGPNTYKVAWDPGATRRYGKKRRGQMWFFGCPAMGPTNRDMSMCCFFRANIALLAQVTPNDRLAN